MAGVGISFVGDGASNQGMFLESLNLAAVWNLPAIFVVENNGYAESTSRDYAVARRIPMSIAPPASACPASPSTAPISSPSMKRPAKSSSGRAKAAARRCSNARWSASIGHFEGDQQTYRGKGEVEDIRANKRLHQAVRRARVIEAGVIKPRRARSDRQARSRGSIDEAVADAKAAPLPRAGRPADRRLCRLLTQGDPEDNMARKISMRQAINEALDQEMPRDPTVIVMGEDIVGGTGGDGEDDAWGGVLGVTKGLYAKHRRPAARHAAVRKRLYRRRGRRRRLRHAPGCRTDVHRLHGRLLRPDLQPGGQVQIHVRRQGGDAGRDPRHGAAPASAPPPSIRRC